MKTFFTLLVAGLAFALTALVSPALAQKDPFTSAIVATKHHVLTFETYRLQQKELDALHDGDLSSNALFDRVRELVETGAASLESVMAVAATPIERATSASTDELIFPTSWDPPAIGQPYGFPTCFEMRPLGEQIQLETDAKGEGSPVQLTVAPEFARLRGFTVQVADRSADGDVQPLIASRKMNTKVMCPLDVPVLLGTMSPPAQTGIAEADGEGSTSLVFVRVRLGEPQVPASAFPSKIATVAPGKNLRLVFRCYSLPMAAARDLLATTTDGDKLLQMVRESPAESVKLERLISMTAVDGYRAAYEEQGERIYGTELVPPQVPVLPDNEVTVVAGPPVEGGGQAALATPKVKILHGAGLLPAWFSAFDMRPVGWRFEVEPTVLPGGRHVKLAVAPERTEFRGMVKGHPLLERYPEQPVFASQKLTTMVTAAVGHQCFLGTMAEPQDSGVNGRKGDGRTWLAFLKVVFE